jgi:tetratricopeptide (TPR) repeat protein
MADKDKERKTTGTRYPDRDTEPDEIARYQGILARESSSLVFAALAEAYRKRNMLDQAIAVCKKGLHHHPDFVSGRVALARAYVEKGDADRATKELERVILAAPDNLIAQKLLMTIYQERGDGDILEGTVHRVLSLDPKDVQARKTWQRLQSLRSEDADAVETAGRRGEIVTRTLAEIYASQGYHQKAFEIYRELSAREPENSGIHERIADLKLKNLCRGARTK